MIELLFSIERSFRKFDKESDFEFSASKMKLTASRCKAGILGLQMNYWKDREVPEIRDGCPDGWKECLWLRRSDRWTHR